MSVNKKKAMVVVAETYHYAVPFFEGSPEREKFLSYGHAFPNTQEYESVAWWMAGGYAARMYVSGIAPALSAPGAHWLSDIPSKWLGREVITGTAEELPENLVWAKPSEVKIPSMKPGWWGRKSVQEMGNPSETLYQWTETFLEGLNHEHRVFMVHGEPVTWSPYLIDGEIYSHGMVSEHTNEAVQFARLVAQELGRQFPPVCSLDVGRTNDGWVIIETNPAWSSGLYGCDPSLVVEALDIACSETNPRWMWQPSTFAIEQANKNMGFLSTPEGNSGLLKLHSY